VNSDINLSPQHGFLDLLDKEALAADLRQRDIEDFIADGLDLGQGDFHAGISFLQFGLNPIGLPEGQLTGASTDAKLFGCHKTLHFYSKCTTKTGKK